jgi:hypothetical protein
MDRGTPPALGRFDALDNIVEELKCKEKADGRKTRG